MGGASFHHSHGGECSQCRSPPPLTIAFELVGDFGFCHKGEERERETHTHTHHLCNEQFVCTSVLFEKKAWQQSLNIVFTLPSAPPTTTLKSSYWDTDGGQKKKKKKKKTQKKQKEKKRKKRKEMIFKNVNRNFFGIIWNFYYMCS
jgi:hypothetical protein